MSGTEQITVVDFPTLPELQPISLGNISQGTPLFRTNMMSVSAWRLLKDFRPGYGFGWRQQALNQFP
jgi:hypothetical protein